MDVPEDLVRSGEDAFVDKKKEAERTSVGGGAGPVAECSLVGRGCNSTTISKNQIFSSKAQLRSVIRQVALDNHFNFKTEKSDVERLIVKCVDPGCKWRLRAVSHGHGGIFKVKQYTSAHTCPLRKRSSQSRVVDQNFIGEWLVKTYAPRALFTSFLCSVVAVSGNVVSLTHIILMPVAATAVPNTFPTARPLRH